MRKRENEREGWRERERERERGWGEGGGRVDMFVRCLQLLIFFFHAGGDCRDRTVDGLALQGHIRYYCLNPLRFRWYAITYCFNFLLGCIKIAKDYQIYI